MALSDNGCIDCVVVLHHFAFLVRGRRCAFVVLSSLEMN
jgi:hypothetical protein